MSDHPNVEALRDAGLIKKELPDELRQAVEEIPAEHINIILDVKERFDQADVERGATTQPPFTVFISF